MGSSLDLLSICRVGMILRTRDRREARIIRLDPASGLIHGEVTMEGLCAWHADGRWRGAPFGAAGPLDLMPPGEPASPRHATVSVGEALDPANRLFCCD